VLDRAEGPAASIEPAPATPAEILAAQARDARDAAPLLARHADDTSGYENGRIPGGDLCELSFAPGETLRCDAAEQLERLDVAYHARFGAHLKIRDSYRSYDAQVSVKASRGYLAAVPGHSNHGWAVAVDLAGGVQRFDSARYAWLREHAPEFGWDNPSWARSDGRKPEAWHWEYTPLR
jgi:LAS superfamily LD-carboxypeptidase LdcB